MKFRIGMKEFRARNLSFPISYGILRVSENSGTISICKILQNKKLFTEKFGKYFMNVKKPQTVVMRYFPFST
jgi:hypothetical protein